MRFLQRLGGPGGLLGLLAATLTACAPPPPPAIVDYAVRDHNIGELVASADAVLVGQVIAINRGRVLDHQDVVYTFMNIRVAVERVWAGRLPATAFTIERSGWERAARRPGWRGWFDDTRERESRVAGELRLKDGDRGVFFVTRTNDAPGWYVLAPEGLYLIDGADLVDTNRPGPLVPAVEAMTVARLEQAVTDAAAAVKRGEPKPKRPPGG
jgi:hypothetical protein